MFRRITGGQVGIVSTAAVVDATPAGVVAHTSQRSQADAIAEQFLNGVTANYSWTKWDGPDVRASSSSLDTLSSQLIYTSSSVFGGGGADFLPRSSNGNVSKIAKFQERGYNFVHDNTSLAALGSSSVAPNRSEA
jgi:alkaline phosphatase